jgi:hypothetical protein
MKKLIERGPLVLAESAAIEKAVLAVQHERRLESRT